MLLDYDIFFSVHISVCRSFFVGSHLTVLSLLPCDTSHFVDKLPTVEPAESEEREREGVSIERTTRSRAVSKDLQRIYFITTHIGFCRSVAHSLLCCLDLTSMFCNINDNLYNFSFKKVSHAFHSPSFSLAPVFVFQFWMKMTCHCKAWVAVSARSSDSEIWGLRAVFCCV